MGLCVGSQMARVSERANKDVLCRIVSEKSSGCDETRKCESIGNLLYGGTSGTQSGRGDVRAAVVVHDDSDDEVDCGHTDLRDDQGASVVTGITHLGYNRKESRGGAVGEDEG